MHRRSFQLALVAVLLAIMAVPALALGAGSRARAAQRLALVSDAPSMAQAPDPNFIQTNLVSDVPGMAQVTDPNLVNPWGITAGPTSPFWISDNHSGLSTLYDTAGVTQPLVVTIPPPAGSPAGTLAAPSGVVFNGTATDFVVSAGGKSGNAAFIFATEDGTLSGWSPNVDSTNAILTVDNSSTGAVYKGLALASSGGKNYLYATNFNAGTVDVFDAGFKPAHLAGNFSDPHIPSGFAPFGIRLLGPNLYVTYAMQNGEKHDDVAGAGNGFVDSFDTSGNLVQRFAAQGTLNSPWGLAIAPASFGRFAGDVLVGNFGDGRINAFATDGAFAGQLTGEDQQPLTISGLWGLFVGNGGKGGDPNTLYFTAGPDSENHGLFGSLAPVPAKQAPASTMGGQAGAGPALCAPYDSICAYCQNHPMASLCKQP